MPVLCRKNGSNQCCSVNSCPTFSTLLRKVSYFLPALSSLSHSHYIRKLFAKISQAADGQHIPTSRGRREVQRQNMFIFVCCSCHVFFYFSMFGYYLNYYYFIISLYCILCAPVKHLVTLAFKGAIQIKFTYLHLFNMLFNTEVRMCSSNYPVQRTAICLLQVNKLVHNNQIHLQPN